MSNVIPFPYRPQRLQLDGGGALVLDDRARSRGLLAMKKACEYAKHKAALLYPDPERRKREETRIAHEEYRRLMYP